MKTRLFTTLTAALLALSAWADGTEIDGIHYKLNSSTKTASVTYTGSSGNYNPSSTAYTGSITISASVNYSGTTYSVTSIGDHAFFGCTGLTSITIPSSVTSIGEKAFMGCNGLTSITIPKSVTSIDRHAFSWCSGLTSITLPSFVTSICDGAFEECTGLTSITIPSSVTSIGDGAFNGCTGLTSITLPESVTSIGGLAFRGCTGLTSITIPSSVTSIGMWAFYGCTGLTSIKVEAGNTKYDSRNNCNAIIETASNTLVAGCKTTTIPSSVTSIGGYAFLGCTGLTSITIPSSVTSIGDYAFYECTGLTSITACKMEPSEYNCSTSAFYDLSYSSVTLYVPAGSASAYRALEPWSNFSNIVETDLTSIQTPR